MKNLLMGLVGFGLTVTYAAAPSLVRCHKNGQVKEYMILTLNERQKIVQANKKQYIVTSPKSEFSVLSMDLEEVAWESIHSFKASNGYSLVRFISTADAITVGISGDLQKGFYKYEDLGSGNGHSEYSLVCKKK